VAESNKKPSEENKVLQQNGIASNLLLIFTLLILTVAAAFFYITYKKPMPASNQTSDSETSQNTDQPAPTPQPTTTYKPDITGTPDTSITTIDNEWNNYSNAKLGFTINYPKTAVNSQGGCVWSTDSYRPKPSMVPVKIFEDTNAIYINYEYSYELTGQTSKDGRSKFSGCEQKQITLEYLRGERRTWNIIVKEVKNDQELEAFIKQRFGAGCLLGEKNPTSQTGVFSVQVKGDGKDLEFTTCPLNYMFILKYAPAIGKAFTFDRGQSFAFPKDVNYNSVYDDAMEKSFKILTN